MFGDQLPSVAARRVTSCHRRGPPSHRESAEQCSEGVARGRFRSMRAAGRAHMRTGRRGAARQALAGGWAAARAVDVFGGSGSAAARGGGLNPEVGRRWSERARSAARLGGLEPAGEPWVPGNGSRGALVPWGGKGSGLAVGERRVLRPGRACEGASSCFGRPSR